MLTRSCLSGGTLAALLAGAACERPVVPENDYYGNHIQPVFDTFCVGNTSPCHRIDPATGVALGNLDMTSFEAVHKRPDVLRTYGAYPEPLLILKSIPEEATHIPYRGQTYVSEIRHVGGKTIAVDSDAFFELKNWLANGATRTGIAPERGTATGQGDCNGVLPEDEDLPPVDRASAAYRQFQSTVAPLLTASCASATCHGSPQSDFYLTCGTTDAQRDFNFLRAASFVADPPGAGEPATVDQSELLRRPLSPQAGGVSHTGGVFYGSKGDAGWRALQSFAMAVQSERPIDLRRSPGEAFFTERVMPVLLRRGCALEACHSPNGFNDFRLRPGTLGFLSPFAVRRNYETTLHEFLNLDSADVKQSRLVRKNILPSDGGIAHRGGPILQSPGEDVHAPCPPYDPARATAYCTLAEWHRIERADHAGDVSALRAGDVLPLVFVERPPDSDSPLQFDTFRGGADLKLADAHLDERGGVARVDNVRSALAGCEGLAGRADLDVRGPEFSFDATRIVFAARAGANAGLDLWELTFGADRAPSSCTRLTRDEGRMQGPARVHNFDPVYAPDGSLVFASTRAGTLTLKTRLPNADLYRVRNVGTLAAPRLDFARVERMTWLTNSELQPAFMQNGQLAFTAEKATPGFYQLSGRRINWDLTDYHPLIVQRAQSDDTFGVTRPSANYQQATEIREDLDRNFLVILSNHGARGGGGALGLFNRSIGPFEEGRNEVTFLHALTLADRAAHGRPACPAGTTPADDFTCATVATRGVYRSPYPTPSGEILASYAGNVADPRADTPRYDLVAVDPTTGARRTLLEGGAASLVEAALGYKRAQRKLFHNVPQLVFGGRSTGEGDAVMHIPDVPALATLLDANLRRARNLAPLDAARALRAYEVLPPPGPNPPAGMLQGPEGVYTERRLVGGAPLAADRSVRVALPAGKPLILEFVDGSGRPVFTMREEHQMGPGESITPGVPRRLFDAVCGGCHGALSGREADVVVSTDALTGASVSMSRGSAPASLRP